MNSKWIWNSKDYSNDEYVEFITKINSNSKNAKIRISSGTDYALYINNKFIKSGQYATYPDYPVYDEIDVNLKPGENDLKIIGYHCGASFFTYYVQLPGIWFEVYDSENNLIAYSSKEILSQKSNTYESGLERAISPQLGFSFKYDATKEKEPLEYTKSVVMDKSYNFRNRENKFLKCLKKPAVTYVVKDSNKAIVDLGEEMTGFVYLDFKSSNGNNVVVSVSEFLDNGEVRKHVGPRNFFFDYIAKRGRNVFFSPFRRFGLRYIEIESENKIDINYIGIIPTYYPFIKKPFKANSELRQRIYDTAVHTLECCYHEHYEDCPWREQSFYALDSRNQMVAGYYAFKNREQVRSAIKLMAMDNREDGILSICSPSKFDLTIPSFSLHFFQAVLEYYKHTKDKTLLVEVYPKLKSLIQTFINNMEDGLVKEFLGDEHWNFYEWMDGLDYPKSKYDLILNALFINALEELHQISLIIGETDNYKEIANEVRKNANKAFYSRKEGLYYFSKENKLYSELANALAILSGIAKGKKAKEISKLLMSENNLIKATLSMRCLVYDGLLKVSKDNKEFVLNDIDSRYKKMLDAGATTFWETEDGAIAFDNAGSLCHGWSAMPIYYYNKLK